MSLDFFDRVIMFQRSHSMTPPVSHQQMFHAIIARDFKERLAEYEKQKAHEAQFNAALVIVRVMRKLFFRARLLHSLSNEPFAILKKQVSAAIFLQKTLRHYQMYIQLHKAALIIQCKQRVFVARSIFLSLRSISSAAHSKSSRFESPTSVIDSLGLGPPTATPARARFRSHTSRARTPFGKRSKPPTPPASAESNTSGGAQFNIPVSREFDYKNWAAQRRAESTDARTPHSRNSKQSKSNRGPIRSRGTHKQYTDTQRFSFLRSTVLYKSGPFSHLWKMPRSNVSSATPLRKTPEKPMAAQPAAHVFDDYDSDGATTFRSRMHDTNDFVLALASDTPAPHDTEAKPPAKEPTSSIGEKGHPGDELESRFELPPSLHPSLSGGSGGYIEEHETENGFERHGYEFFGKDDSNASERSMDMHSAQGYHDDSPENEYEQNEEFYEQDDGTDHGDDVGPEEDYHG